MAVGAWRDPVNAPPPRREVVSAKSQTAMHGRRKSDSSVVPKKLSNKDRGAPRSAERVDGRDWPKGMRKCQTGPELSVRKEPVEPPLNGHTTGNCRYSQGKPPVAVSTCKVCSCTYGMQPRRITTSFKQRDGQTLNIRKATKAEKELTDIYEALGITAAPGGTEKMVA